MTVTGLTNGDRYTFTVTATNGVGTGPASASPPVVTPAGLPGVPTGLAAVGGDGQAVVSWSPPASTGGAAVAFYTVTATDITTPAYGGQTVFGPSSPVGAHLREFADHTPWVHLDIAGTAWENDRKPHMAKGPTGVAIRTLFNYVCGHAAK